MSSGKWLCDLALKSWLTIVLLVYAIVGALTISHDIAWGDDWAQYVLHARNLLAGHAYADTGYIFNVDAPNVGPPTYPPGLPMLLAAAMSICGLNLIALKLVCFACVVLALPLMFAVLQRDFGRGVAIVSVLMFAMHDQVWSLRDTINSEMPYLLVTMLTLWVLTSHRGSDQPPLMSGILSGIGLGTLAYAAVACRSIGIAMVPAMLVYGYARRRALGWFLGVVLTLALLVWLQKIFIVMPATYGNELKTPTLALAYSNMEGYVSALAGVFRMPLGLSGAAAYGVLVLMAIGAVTLCRRKQADELAVLGIRALLARLPASALYLGAYTSALLLAAIAPQPRYLLPVLPIAVAIAATAFVWIASRLPRPNVTYWISISVLVLYYVTLSLTTPSFPVDGVATCKQCQELFSFVRDKTPPNTIVAFAKPRAMALLGDRPTWAWSPSYTPAVLRARIDALKVGLLVIGAPGSAWATKNPAPVSSEISPAGFAGTIAFKNDMFVAIWLPRHSKTSVPP